MRTISSSLPPRACWSRTHSRDTHFWGSALYRRGRSWFRTAHRFWKTTHCRGRKTLSNSWAFKNCSHCRSRSTGILWKERISFGRDIYGEGDLELTYLFYVYYISIYIVKKDYARLSLSCHMRNFINHMSACFSFQSHQKSSKSRKRYTRLLYPRRSYWKCITRWFWYSRSAT